MTHESDSAALMDEIQRYLAAADAFRAAGCRPRWQTDRPVVPGGRQACSQQDD